MGRLFVEYLPEGRKYACKECLAGCGSGHSVVHLAAVSDLLSKSFHSRHGPAYLFTNAVNVTLGTPEERDMTTGKHIVRDLYCIACGTNLGWRYEMAHERREKYKEGKYILERLQLVDLEAASTSTQRALGLGGAIPAMPPAPQFLLHSSSAFTTAVVPGSVASPTGVMGLLMMPENASPLSSSGERSPYGDITSIVRGGGGGGGRPSPPPPPPPARPLSVAATPAAAAPSRGYGTDMRFHSIINRSNVSGANELEETESLPELIPYLDSQDLRASFSQWPRTDAIGATATGATVAATVTIRTATAHMDVNRPEEVDVGVSPAITDAPPHFNMEL